MAYTIIQADFLKIFREEKARGGPIAKTAIPGTIIDLISHICQ